MKSKLLVMLLVLIVMLGVTVVSVAQDEWPDGCQLPDLEAAMKAANEAQADGDVAAFVDGLSEMNLQIDQALRRCLSSAVWDDVDLSEVDLSEANLQGANLSNANLQGANLYVAEVRWAYLAEANLTEANLWHTNLEGAYLTRANLEGTYLYNANLARTNLSNANLHRVNTCSEYRTCVINLSGADLTGANLKESVLVFPTLYSRIFDETTVLPDGTNWTPDTDMTRFTDPEHPDFWDPCVELDSPPWYCEDSG